MDAHTDTPQCNRECFHSYSFVMWALATIIQAALPAISIPSEIITEIIRWYAELTDIDLVSDDREVFAITKTGIYSIENVPVSAQTVNVYASYRISEKRSSMIVTMRAMSSATIIVSDGKRALIQGDSPFHLSRGACFAEVPVEGPIVSIGCGEDHVMIATTRGLFAAGCNLHRQLGIEDPTYRHEAFRVPGCDHVLAVACGSYHTLVLTSDGLYGCGNNKYSQITNSAFKRGTLTKIGYASEIRAFGYTSCIRIVDGTPHGTWETRGLSYVSFVPEYDPDDARAWIPRGLTTSESRAKILRVARKYGRAQAAVYCDNLLMVATRNGIFAVSLT
jgi:hypothetical protein